MGGDTGKIIGYTALAVAAVYTGGAAMGYWGAGAKAGSLAGTGIGKAGVGFGKAGAGTGFAKGATVSNTGTGFGFASGGGFAPGTVPMATNAGTAGMSSLGSLGSSSGIGSLSAIGGAGGGGSMVANSLAPGLVKNASYSLASNAPTITNTALNTSPTLTSSLGSLNAPDPTFLGTMGNAMSGVGNYVAENPLSSYFLGQGALNQMTAPNVGDYPMADFTSLQQQQTYDQTLSGLSLDQLNNELSRPGITQHERNSISRAMQARGISDDRIQEAQARALHGEQRYAEVSKAMGDFRDATNKDQGDLDAQAALIYATYKDDSDKTFNDAKTQLKQQYARAGRLYSRGGDDAFAQITGKQTMHNADLKQKAMEEAMRRNKSNADLQLQGANAILAGANYGDTLDRYAANLNENNRRFQLGDLKDASQQNYNTNLLGLQGANNYNLAKYKQDKSSADAQALQGLELTKLGMRGFDDLVPLGSRSLYYGI